LTAESGERSSGRAAGAVKAGDFADETSSKVTKVVVARQRDRVVAEEAGETRLLPGAPSMGADLRVRVSITEVDCTNR